MCSSPPILDAVRQVYEAGADIIALDCTNQINADGRPAWELFPEAKKAFPDAMFFADVSNFEEAERAVAMGADIVGPTLYGYTAQTKHIEEPDLREFAHMCRAFGDDVYMGDGGAYLLPGGRHQVPVLRLPRGSGGQRHHPPPPDHQAVYRPDGRLPEQLARRGEECALIWPLTPKSLKM